MGNKAVLSTSHGGCLTPVELETCGVTESGELTLEEAAAKYKMPAAVWTRPATAHGAHEPDALGQPHRPLGRPEDRPHMIPGWS